MASSTHRLLSTPQFLVSRFSLPSPPSLRPFASVPSSSYSSSASPSFLYRPSRLRSTSTPLSRRRKGLRPVPSAPFVFASLGNLSEAELVSIPSVPGELDGKFPSGAGVYAIYDKEGGLQFIGISRNVASSIASHSKFVPDLCHSVKVLLMLLEPS